MVTTVHEPPQIDPDRLPDHSSGNDGSGNGGRWNLVPESGELRGTQDYSPPPSSTAIWVVLFAITMMFAAFTSALIVRKASSLDWQGFTLPSVLYFNTLVLIISSATLEVARRRVARLMGSGLKSQEESPARWLHITFVLGLLFVAGQFVAWSQLRAEGLYLATNPSSSFFYLLTVTHAMHVLGGLGGLIYVMRKLSKSVLRRNQLVATARYWHFIGVLWVYLLVLLWVKL